MKSFGVGCLHFGIGDNLDKKTITVQEYLDEIVKVLEHSSTISDIHILCNEDILNENINIISPSPKLSNGDSCYPFIDFFSLEYSVYIPFRIQSELTGSDEKYLDTFTENFKVYLKHNWYGPLTFIESIDAGTDSQPSTAVQIVREYIAREIKTINTFLIADRIGPSPFHADFFLTMVEEIKSKKSSLFKLRDTKTSGYAKLDFTCAENSFESEDIALENLMYELETEIAFFYNLKVMDSSRLREWEDINHGLHTILDFENSESKKTFKEELILYPKMFRKVFLDIGLFKGQDIFNNNTISSHYSSIYKNSGDKYHLQSFIDQEISDTQTYPVEETSELLKYFDQKSTKSFELMVVFGASVVGGLIGAIITVLFSK